MNTPWQTIAWQPFGAAIMLTMLRQKVLSKCC